MSVYNSKQLCIIDNATRLKKIKEKIKKGMKTNSKFAVYMIDKLNQVYIASFLPVKDFSHTKVLAWFISYEKNDFIHTTIKNGRFFRIVLFFIILFLLYFIYRVLNQKEILNQKVDKKTFELKKLNDNLEETIKNEVDKNNKQQLQLLEQSKKAQMGEMIENIAHQWRQPLSVISTISTGMQVEKDFNILTDESFTQSCTQINDNVEYLSETINTFRNFLKEKKELKNIIVQDDINKAIKIVKPTLKDNNIELKTNINSTNSIKLILVTGELPQVIINIINNAKDILIEKNIKNPYIELNLIKEKNKITISIEDNAGGIPENIILKIFDPYFTTKHHSHGTGLGLNMSYKIITDSLKGNLYVKNTNNGAKFFIELPIDNQNLNLKCNF